jgi:hypothetical protein
MSFNDHPGATVTPRAPHRRRPARGTSATRGRLPRPGPVGHPEAPVALIAGGFLLTWRRREAADLVAARISAFAGSAVAAGRVVGMLFERWPDPVLAPGRASSASAAGVAILAASSPPVCWPSPTPSAGLEWRARGVGRVRPARRDRRARRVILHVAIGHRWRFAFPDESRSKA